MLVELKIVFNPKTGEVHVTGPIEQKMLCYGMLGMAHDVVKDFNPDKVSRIQPSRIIPNGNGR